MKVGGAWAKGGFRNALRSSGQAGATAEKATATAGTKNDVATPSIGSGCRVGIVAQAEAYATGRRRQRQKQMRIVGKTGAVV
jgi:hypothetical protein